MRKPWTQSTRPPQFSPSYAKLGIIAEEGCLIELRAPDGEGVWPRIYLTPDAAAKLLKWLPDAISMQGVGVPDAG